MRKTIGNVAFAIILKIKAFRIKDVDIQGDDERGYRFLIWNKKPMTIKVKDTEIVLKKGEVRYTGYFDTTKEKLARHINNAISENKKGLEMEISYGMGFKETVFIPAKHYEKLINKLYGGGDSGF